MPKLLLASFLIVCVFLAGCSTTPKSFGPGDDYEGSGVFTEYHDNGKVKRRAEYADGQLVSVTSYFASGVQKSEEHYSNGKIANATYYLASGRIKATLVE